jgi:hypothetical protein
MARLVSVRYLVPVYCTVDLDTPPRLPNNWYPDSAVTRVFEADEDIHHPATDIVTDAVEANPEDQATFPLSHEDFQHAIDIANHTVWPAWERG